MSRRGTAVTIDGVKYESRTAAAKALVAAGKTLAEAAEATGMTYQTVYANTKGAEKVSKRRANYRVLAMGRRGKKTPGEIAKKTGLTVSAVVALLKKHSIAIVTKENKETKSTSKKRQKIVKPENIITVSDPVKDEVPQTPAQDEIPEDAVAAMQAMSDSI